jgi:hypothetical protein
VNPANERRTGLPAPICAFLLVACLAWAGRAILYAAVPSRPAGPPAAEGDCDDDPLGDNAACYVCHMTFIKEDLAKQHLVAKVGCIKCHGLSEKHANDENIGTSKPDILFPRGGIDAGCVKCHEKHDVSARKVIARFVDRRLPSTPTPVCTDCHGHHKIEKEKAAPSGP